MTITANMVSLSLSTVSPPGSDALVSLLGVDAGIPASVRTVVGDGWLYRPFGQRRVVSQHQRVLWLSAGSDSEAHYRLS